MNYSKTILILSCFLCVSGCAIRPDARFFYEEPAESQSLQPGAAVTDSTALTSAQMTMEISSFEKFKQEIQSFWRAPYQWGGNSPAGTDCSGMISTIYRNAVGIKLPRSTIGLFKTGKGIAAEELTFGDLVFFAQGRSLKPSHVGMYITGDIFLHASVSTGVALSKLTEHPWQDWYIGAKRILD